METAWNYFKCDEEVFKILFNIQDQRTQYLFMKKWGRDLKGINNSGIKKNDIDLFNNIIDIFRCKIIYINNLKETKSLEEIKNIINDIDIIEILKIKFNTTNDELMTAIDNLKEEQRTCFIYYYGIGRNKLSEEKIANLVHIEEEEVIAIIKRTEFNINSYIRMKKQSMVRDSRSSSFKRPAAYFNQMNNIPPKPVISLEKPVEKVSPKEEVSIKKTNEVEKEDIKEKNIQQDSGCSLINNYKIEHDNCLEYITKKVNSKQLTNIDKIIIYTKLKTTCNEYITDEEVDEFIINSYNLNLNELIRCYINNLELFDDVNGMINQILSYDPKYINQIYNSAYVTNILSQKSLQEQINFYNSLNRKIKEKQKSK